jgi:hypothetical protein
VNEQRVPKLEEMDEVRTEGGIALHLQELLACRLVYLVNAGEMQTK